MATVFLVIIAFFVHGLNVNPNKVPSAQLNLPALEFNAAWLQGQEHLAAGASPRLTLASLKGKPVVLNFWASWCYSCREEARDFERFWRERSNKDVQVVGIAIQDTPEKAMEFARQYGKTYMLGLDEDGKAGIDYGVTGVPETFLIDKDGRILLKESAPVTYETLKAWEAKYFAPSP